MTSCNSSRLLRIFASRAFRGVFACDCRAVDHDSDRMSSSAEIAVLRRALDRATFGAGPALLDEVRKLGWEAWIDEQLAPEEKHDEDLDRRLKKLKLLIEYEMEPAAGGKMMMGKSGKDRVKEMRPLKFLDCPIEKVFPLCRDEKMAYAEKQRPMDELQMSTILGAVTSRWQVREMAVAFWHDHFSI